MIHIVALSEVKDADAFMAFEMQVIEIMKKYGGNIAVAFETSSYESSMNSVVEVHYLRFPSMEAYDNYCSDPRLEKMSSLREKAIANTIYCMSENLKYYDQ